MNVTAVVHAWMTAVILIKEIKHEEKDNKYNTGVCNDDNIAISYDYTNQCSRGWSF